MRPDTHEVPSAGWETMGPSLSAEPPHPERGRGRPPVLSVEERRLRLFDAAEAVFQSHGYAASSIDEISRVAGMSKKTIYRWFASKEALFLGLLQHSATEILENCPTVEEGCSPAVALENFLRHAAHSALSPRIVGLLRLMISEARHWPDVAQSFHRKMVERCQLVIMRLLAQNPELLAQNRRVVGGEDALRQVACLLYEAAVTELQLRMLLGLDEASAASLIDERIRQSLAAFFRNELRANGDSTEFG
jgi:TetR/AcrR family transcriptional regulator, mexJK operon transcriptional repressor